MKKLINKILGQFYIKVFSIRHGYGYWIGNHFVYSKTLFGNSTDFCIIPYNWSYVDNDVTYASGRSIFGLNGELLTDEEEPQSFNNVDDFKDYLKDTED